MDLDVGVSADPFGSGRSPEANQVYDWEFNDRMRLGCK